MTHPAPRADGGSTEPATPRTKSHVARVALVVAAAGLVHAYVLYYAFTYGVLSGLLQWDDCNVVLRGIANLHIITRAQSVYWMAREIPYLTIHAPLSDVQTMLGLLMSGGAVWGPFVLNVVPVLLAVYAIVFRPGRTDDWLFAALLILVLVQPLTINALTYVKSDWKGGVLIAAAVLALNESAERRSKGLKYTGAALLGLALMSKLTAFYYPALAVAILIAFEAYGWFLGRDGAAARMGGNSEPRIPSRYGWREGRVLLQCIAIAVMPYALFFLVYLRRTLTYIKYALGDTWTDGFTYLERAAYYSPASVDGAAAWGNLHILFAVFAACCAVIAIARRSYGYLVSLACVFVLAALFLAPLLVAKTSNIGFAAGFLGIVLGAVLIAICTFARALPRWGGLAALVVTAPLVLRAPLPISASAYGATHAPQASDLRELESVYLRLESLLESSSAARPRVLVFYDNIFAPHPNLGILFFQRTGRLLSLERVDDMSNRDTTVEKLADADFALTFVVAGNDSVLGRKHGLNWRLPVSVHPGVADAFVARQPGFALMQVLAAPGGEIHLYRHERAAEPRSPADSARRQQLRPSNGRAHGQSAPPSASESSANRPGVGARYDRQDDRFGARPTLAVRQPESP